ncbi:Protein kinase domain-containing protein [Mycena kentingensis (nom. inval.)]|nr:Protein kinase domain-containing protein [Mycena kentingensis (nom. inval.)]
MVFWSSKKWNPQGLHCYITGGSSGMGLALAVQLAQRGAHISIVARDEKKLQDALAEIEKARVNPDQQLRFFSFDLNSADASAAALDAAAGGAWREGAGCGVYVCRRVEAGILRRAGRGVAALVDGYGVLGAGMDGFGCDEANGARAPRWQARLHRVRPDVLLPRRILQLQSWQACAAGYVPSAILLVATLTAAAAGLAESLRSELQLYDISVHLCTPGTIYSPGYIEENKTKPKITLKIEESDEGLQPEQVAAALIRGVEKNHFHIPVDLLGDLFRASTRGATPQNGYFLDVLYAFIGWIAIAVWRRGVDKTIVQHGKKEHKEYLQQKGFLKD